MYSYLLFLILKLVGILLLVFISIILGTLYHLGVRLSWRSYSLISKIDGPKGYFLIGNVFDLLSVTHDTVLQWVGEMIKLYPVRYKVWLFGISAVVFVDADDFQSILSSNDNITKGIDYDTIRPWLEEGLLVSTGEKWHNRRKLLTPAFHFKILEDNMHIFNEGSKDLAETFLSKQNLEIEMEHFISHCTLRNIMKAAMGININEIKLEGERYISEIKTASEIFTVRHMSPHLYNETIFHLTPMGRKFKKCIKFLQGFSSRLIQERKVKMNEDSGTVSSSGKKRKAFLDLMLDYESKFPGSFSDKGIREEVDTFMFEGHDTTASAVNFIFYNLARFQDVQETVYNELRDIFQDSDRDVTVGDLQNMVYLERVIKETLRLYPSVPAVTRFLQKDLVLSDGVVVPARTDALYVTYFLHRNEKYWPDPEKFDPDRFLEENIIGRHPYCYVPFSAGPRNCIGQKFAMMELKTIVANVIRKLKILPVTKHEDVVVVEHIVLRTLHPIKCKFVQRKNV